MSGDRDELWGVASAATFARCMLRKDHPAARTIFDQVTADPEDLLAFATGLVSLTNAVLTGIHGERLADRYLADVAGQGEVARSADRDDLRRAGPTQSYEATRTTRAGGSADW